MALLNSDLTNKRIRHRGLYVGKEQSVSAKYRVAAGGSIALADSILMVPCGENQRITRLVIFTKAVSGTPALTNPTFSVGVSPITTATVTRPDGTTYAPLTASATRLAAAIALGTDEMATITEVDSPADLADWGPFHVTLTPAGAGAFSVASGDIELILTAVITGEASEAAAVYSEFNATKYKN